MSEQQITVKQWTAYQNDSPGNKRTSSKDKSRRSLSGDASVASISYSDAEHYCEWLTERAKAAGLEGFEIRIPTEIEWEVAMRQAEEVATRQDDKTNSAPRAVASAASYRNPPPPAFTVAKGTLREWTLYRIDRAEYLSFPRTLMDWAKDHGGPNTLIYSPVGQHSRYFYKRAASTQSKAVVKGARKGGLRIEKEYVGYRGIFTAIGSDEMTGFRVVMVRAAARETNEVKR